MVACGGPRLVTAGVNPAYCRHPSRNHGGGRPPPWYPHRVTRCVLAFGGRPWVTAGVIRPTAAIRLLAPREFRAHVVERLSLGHSVGRVLGIGRIDREDYDRYAAPAPGASRKT